MSAAKADAKSAIAVASDSQAQQSKKKPKVYQYVPVLEELLILLVIVEPIWMCVALVTENKKNLLLAYAAAMVAAPIVVEASKFVFRHIGNAIAHRVHKWGMVNERPLRNKKQMGKWMDQAWQLVVHTFFTMWEVYVIFYLPRQAADGQNTKYAWPNLWYDPHMMWYPPPEEQQAKEFENFPLLALYLAELGVWTYTAFSCAWLEHRKKDFYPMMIHHVVTIALVGSSLLSWNERAGLLVLFINDACDVSVDVLKMANFLTLDGLKGFFIVEVAFLQMLFFHFYWRIWEGPGRVLYTTFWRAHEMNAYRQSNLILAIDHRHVLIRLDNSKLNPEDDGITYTCVETACPPGVVDKLLDVYRSESAEIASSEEETAPHRWREEQIPRSQSATVAAWEDANVQKLVAANIDENLFPSRYTGGILATEPASPWYMDPIGWATWQFGCAYAAVSEYSSVAKFVHLWLESNLLLQILFLLHIYWWWLMLRILYKLLTGTPREASEDEYEGDEEDDDVDVPDSGKALPIESSATASPDRGQTPAKGSSSLGDEDPEVPTRGSKQDEGKVEDDAEGDDEGEDGEEEDEEGDDQGDDGGAVHTKGSLMRLRKKELLEVAKSEGVAAKSSMTKEQIADAVLKKTS